MSKKSDKTGRSDSDPRTQDGDSEQDSADLSIDPTPLDGVYEEDEADEPTDDIGSDEDASDEDASDEDSADEDSEDEDSDDGDSDDGDSDDGDSDDGDSDDGDSDDGDSGEADAVTDAGDGADDDSLDGPEPTFASAVTDRAFTEFPLSPELLQGIQEKGYRLATPVQVAAIEPAIAGRNLVVRSKTGTGKTAAFCIPMIERIASGDRKTRAIVLAPTRELARQVAQECAELAKYKDIRVTVIYGGVPFPPQEDALREGCEIVVGTPGRVIDHMRRGNLDLSECSFACLDEADEMLSMGFFEDVTKILDRTPDGRQVLFFSATVDKRVRQLITRYAKDAEDIRLSTDTDKVEGIEHILYETTPDFHKARALLAIIDQEEPKSALIFCNTREDTATVATYMARQGLDVELISGELPQNKREQVMARVKKGETQFLAATDVAARGIDISDLTHVINYSLPEDPAIYLHRTGRTGRIGKKGIAISLAGGSDISTRKALEGQYEIKFTVKPLPTADEAGQARVERQAAAIKAAMGTMAFEGFVGTVRALKERPDGDLLLAAALRAFFLWDRMRKAANSDTLDSVGALQEAREERAQNRGPRRDSRGGGRSRGERDRGGRGSDRDRGGRGSDRSRDADRPRETERPPSTERARQPERAPERAPASTEPPAAQPDGGGDGANKRRRRRRRRSGGGGGSSSSGGGGSQGD